MPVTGMSFLGLSQDQNPYPDRSLDYLLEEEPQPGRTRLVVAVILLLAAVGMLAWRWRHSGFFSQTHPAVVTAPSTPAQNPQETSPDTSATPAPTPSDSQPAASKTPVHGSPQETDLPPGSTPSTDAAKTQPTPSDDQTSTATPADSGNSTEQAAAPPAAVKPIPVKKPAATPHAVASRAPRTAAVPTEAPTPEIDPVEAQGEKYLYGSAGVPQNCGLAQRSLLESAQRANPKAQSVLGTMYATGHCVGRDLPTAYRWFAKASHQDPNNARITRDLEVLWKQMTAGERQLAVNNRE
jgi:hypothetical protein